MNSSEVVTNVFCKPFEITLSRLIMHFSNYYVNTVITDTVKNEFVSL